MSVELLAMVAVLPILVALILMVGVSSFDKNKSPMVKMQQAAGDAKK